MITPGQTLENPVTGERFTFTDTAASTAGELLAFELALRVGGAVPIPHVHPIQTEHSFANVGQTEARVHVAVRPALRMEQMLAEVVAIAQAGRMTRRGLPRNPLELADLARRYDLEAHAPFLSVVMQRLLLAPLVVARRYPPRRATASSASMS